MPSRLLTDELIDSLVRETKILPSNWSRRLRTRPKSGFQYRQSELEITSNTGHQFKIVIRDNSINQLDFSIILIYEADDNSTYIPRRYNGMHNSFHTNRYEKLRDLSNAQFGPAFHIHMATERYQESDLKIDGYAEVTDRYNDLSSAINSFIQDCGMFESESTQVRLF